MEKKHLTVIYGYRRQWKEREEAFNEFSLILEIFYHKTVEFKAVTFLLCNSTVLWESCP